MVAAIQNRGAGRNASGANRDTESDFSIGKVRNMTPEEVARHRRGGGGRKSEILEAVKQLEPGQGFDIKFDLDEDAFTRKVRSISSSLSSSHSRGVIPFRVQMSNDYETMTTTIRRPDDEPTKGKQGGRIGRVTSQR